MRTAAILTLATMLSLAACNRGPEEKLPSDNSAEVGNVAVAPENVTAAPAAANATNTTATKAMPAPGFTDDQQMKDDADATGMTSRLPDETPASGNATAPVK